MDAQSGTATLTVMDNDAATVTSVGLSPTMISVMEGAAAVTTTVTVTVNVNIPGEEG